MVALEEITRGELERVIAGGVTTVVIPFGSIEDQGHHLPLGADALLADVVGRVVADRLDAVLAPTVRVGHAEQHMSRAGTLSIPSGTLLDVALHVAGSLITHGFRVIVLVSTHGGNQATLEQTGRALGEQFPGVIACAPRGDVGPDPGSHSGRWLTSVMMALRPDLVRPAADDEALKRELRGVTSEIGAVNLERFVSSIVRAVRDVARDSPAGLS